MKKFLENKNRSPSLLSETKKKSSVLQDYTCLEVKKNKQSVVKSFFNDGFILHKLYIHILEFYVNMARFYFFVYIIILK